MRRSVLLATAGLWLWAPLAAQTDPAPAAAETSSTLLLRLSAPQVSLTTAREVAAQLADRQIAVRTTLFDRLARLYADALRRFADDRERLGKRAAKLVPAVQHDQLGRRGAAEVEELRQKARAVTLSPDLTEQRIAAEIDPLLARLQELVLVTPDKLLEHDAALSTQLEGLRSSRDELQGWFELYVETMKKLDDEPAGDRHLERHRQIADPPPAGTVEADLELLCLRALPLSARDQKALAANEELRPSMVEEEYLGTLALNRIRIALGLPALRIDPKLGDAARDHSQDMEKLSFFSHTSPVPGKQTFGQRASRAGTSASAENIAAGQDTGAGAIRAWWYSPGHHKNMLGGHARTGLGRSGGYWTQMFGG